MNRMFHNKELFKKIIAYTSAAVIVTAMPALAVSAAEANSQTSSQPAETPAQQESQSAPVTDTTGADTPATEIPAPQIPSDPTTVITQTPTDSTPIPAPADQGAFAVTPMQSTVYAASPKGLNVRSGPSTSYSKLGTLAYGKEITVTGVTADNWYQIQYSGGVGYILADYVSATPPANTQAPATETPADETPAAETPIDGSAEPDAVETPPDEFIDNDPDSEIQSEDSTSEGDFNEVTSQLIGTPVVIALAAAIVGVIALIGYSVYSLFKKDSNNNDTYLEDEYPDEDGQYPDDGYYNYEYNEYDPYPDDGYYEDEYPDEDGAYPDDGYDEYDSYPDDGYYEDDDRIR